MSSQARSKFNGAVKNPASVHPNAESTTVFGTSRYRGPSGGTGGTSATASRSLMPKSGVVSALFIVVASNTIDGATTFQIRKNGVALGSIILTVAALTNVSQKVKMNKPFEAGDNIDVEIISAGTLGGATLNTCWEIQFD